QAVVRGLLAHQEAQRRRLADVLHDDIGQTLSLLKMQMSVLARQPGQATDSRLPDCLSLVQRAVEQVRNLTQEVGVAMLDDLGVGFDAGRAASQSGLLTMRERVRLAGGRWALWSASGRGTEVQVHFAPGPPAPGG